MVEHRYHIIDSKHPELQTLARVSAESAHKIVQKERSGPVVAISDRALKKAIAAGWW